MFFRWFFRAVIVLFSLAVLNGCGGADGAGAESNDTLLDPHNTPPVAYDQNITLSHGAQKVSEDGKVHSDTVHYFSDGHSGIKIDDIKKRFEREAADFAAKAWKAGIKVLTVVDVEGKERAIARIRRLEPEIRFLLSIIMEDKHGDDGTHGGHPHLQVFRQEEL